MRSLSEAQRRSLPLAVLTRLRVVLVQTNRSPVLKNYKLLAAFQDQRDALPHSIACDTQFCSRNREPWFPLFEEHDLGTHVAQAPLDKKGRGQLNGSGSATEVERRFGGGTFHLSDGGSFGGTGSPKDSREQKGRAADRRPDGG